MQLLIYEGQSANLNEERNEWYAICVKDCHSAHLDRLCFSIIPPSFGESQCAAYPQIKLSHKDEFRWR